MIYVITGPTNTGKDRIAIDLARRLGGEIINADAFHVYNKLVIGTNKPKDEDFQGIKHHLFGTVDVTENYSIAQYQKEARAIIDVLLAQNIPVILLGGSGLYIRAALYDYRFQKEKEIDLSSYESLSNDDLYHKLQNIDLNAARLIHPNNRKRVLRALKIYLSQGTKKSNIPVVDRNKPLYESRFYGINFVRESLYLRISERVNRMVENGLFDEVANLVKTFGSKQQAFNAIGYKEVISCLEGQYSKEEAIQAIISNTRHYVKRQMTFVRHQFPINWIESADDIIGDNHHG